MEADIMDESNLRSFALLKFRDGYVNFESSSLSATFSGTAITTIIGPNGSGKSRALAAIADEFDLLNDIRNTNIDNELSRSARHRDRLTTNCILEYEIDSIRVRIERNKSDVSTWIDDEASALSTAPFPSKVIAVAHLPWDKFRFAPFELDSFYNYLGLRQQTNLTTTGALESRVIRSIIHLLRSDNNMQGMRSWLDLMQLGVQAYIYVDVRPDLLDDERLPAKIMDLSRKASRKSMRSTDKLKPSQRNSPDAIRSRIAGLLSYISSTPAGLSDAKGRSKSRSMRINLVDAANLDLWDALDDARRLGVVKHLGLVFLRGKTSVHFSELSSGEQQLLGTVSSILAHVDDYGSLILIDEPEVSLHPDWQMRFVPTLLKSLNRSKRSHIFIATHSHFMVSDVKSEKMSLLVSSLTSETFNEFQDPVFGRSPDNILYRVFNVASMGNFYVEAEMREALAMISGTEDLDLDRLSDILDRLKLLRAPDNPALNEIVDRIDMMLESLQEGVI